MVQMPSNLAQSGLRIIIRLNVKEASLSIAVQVFVQQLANGELVNITALVRAEIFLNVGEASIAVDSRVDVSSFGSAIKLVALAIEYYHIVEIDEGHLEGSAGLRLDGYVVWVDVGEVEPKSIDSFCKSKTSLNQLFGYSQSCVQQTVVEIDERIPIEALQ